MFKIVIGSSMQTLGVRHGLQVDCWLSIAARLALEQLLMIKDDRNRKGCKCGEAWELM